MVKGPDIFRTFFIGGLVFTTAYVLSELSSPKAIDANGGKNGRTGTLTAPDDLLKNPGYTLNNRSESATQAIQLVKFSPPERSVLPEGVIFPFDKPNFNGNADEREGDISLMHYRIGDRNSAKTEEEVEWLTRNISFRTHNEEDTVPFTDQEVEKLAEEIAQAFNVNREIRDGNKDESGLGNFRRRDLGIYKATSNTDMDAGASAIIKINHQAFGDAIVLGSGFDSMSPEYRAGTLAYLIAINTTPFTDIAEFTKSEGDADINVNVLRHGLAYFIADRASGGGKMAELDEYNAANTPDLKNQKFEDDTNWFTSLGARFWAETEAKVPGTINKVEWEVENAIQEARQYILESDPDNSHAYAVVKLPASVFFDALASAWESSGYNADEWMQLNYITKLQ